MKRFGFAALAVITLVASVGCRAQSGCGASGCNGGCGYGGGGGLHGQAEPAPDYSGAYVGYPYYTTRGPRDYFLNNPPTIGR